MTENTAILYDQSFQNIDTPYQLRRVAKTNFELEHSIEILGLTTFLLASKLSHLQFTKRGFCGGSKLGLLWASCGAGFISMHAVQSYFRFRANRYMTYTFDQFKKEKK